MTRALPETRIPRGLRWSAATSAFQIEGSRTADGRGRSIWDDFVDRPGAVVDGSTAEPACDSYRRSEDDIDLLAGLGVDGYRFSIPWVRIQPAGAGPANRVALDRYSRFVDGLLQRGIEPEPTLYHWELPSELEDAGGWLNRDTASRFADFTALVAEGLGDRVRRWYTINEAAMTTLQGYGIGDLAPARQLMFGALPTVHHQLLAHARAAAVLRGAGAHRVGLTNNHTQVLPASGSEADLAASFAYDTLHNRMFSEPLLAGAYPDIESLGLPPLPVHDGDLEAIAGSLDFYGVNFYNPTTVAAAPDGSPLPFELLPTPGVPLTGFGWPIMPEALRDFLVDLHRRHPGMPPIVIGENGASFPEPDVAATVEDDDRIAFLSAHIGAVADAVDQGVRVEEYTVWSLMDNFEWADGYTQRFGLVHVDFDSGVRTPKASYDWYRRLILDDRAAGQGSTR
ncbi:GH1 family beta-glucosidase [Microbacterium sp. NPDC058342]|uniref:GH1 family beta-glucosidase n=1 Tax=Microbacterium sp. NPDC058342 TaxID=3346454 RepID=UPI003661CDEF